MQLLNMTFVCFFDLVVEAFLSDIFPNWKRRQLLLLDDFLRFMYGQSELWNHEVYLNAFTSKYAVGEITDPEYKEDLIALGKKYRSKYFEAETNHSELKKAIIEAYTQGKDQITQQDEKKEQLDSIDVMIAF